MSGDTEYLQATVGAALAKGVAECVCAGPDDPVAFLGNWLKAYVQNASIKQQVLEENAKIAAESERHASSLAAIEELRKEHVAQRNSVVQKIEDCQGYPRDVWTLAADAVVEHTAVGSAYVMVVSPPEEPEFTFEEEDGEDVPESDDEQDGRPAEVPDAEGEDGPADEAEEPQEAVVPAVDAETVVKDRWDYSQHHLEFVTASPEHQLRIILDNPRLERPAVNADEEEENVLKALPPVTMKMLDDNTPTMHVPCTLQEPRIAYLNEFPAIGAYFAAAVKQKSGSFSSILAADTLVPHGSGQPVSSDDRDLIWELARAVASRLERYPAARIQARVEAFKYASLDEIRDAMVGLRSAQPAVTDTDEQPAHEEDAPGNTNAGEAEEGEDGNVVDNEMEEAEIDPEADSAEKAAHFGKLVRCDLRRFPGLTQVSYLKKKVAGLEATLKDTQKILENETKCMDLVKERISERQADALHELHSYFHAPAATLHVLKAIFRLLDHHADRSRTWSQMLEHINASLFDTLNAYNISTDCDDARWKEIRCAYKGAGDTKKARSRWAYELPVSCLGSLLMLYIRQARRCLIAWRAVKATEQGISTTTTKLESAEEQLRAAQQAVEDAATAEAASAEAAEGDAEEDGEKAS